jgi:hypothetical protein
MKRVVGVADVQRSQASLSKTLMRGGCASAHALAEPLTGGFDEAENEARLEGRSSLALTVTF